LIPKDGIAEHARRRFRLNHEMARQPSPMKINQAIASPQTAQSLTIP
jgi:hypothetical protein